MTTGVTRQYSTSAKVVRLVTRLNIGGVTHHIINLMSGLDPSKYEQQLVCGLEGPGERSLRVSLEKHGHAPILIPHLIGNPRLNGSDAIAFAHILRLLRHHQPMIVH